MSHLLFLLFRASEVNGRRRKISGGIGVHLLTCAQNSSSSLGRFCSSPLNLNLSRVLSHTYFLYPPLRPLPRSGARECSAEPDATAPAKYLLYKFFTERLAAAPRGRFQSIGATCAGRRTGSEKSKYSLRSRLPHWAKADAISDSEPT